jgi:hypothetical protein
MVAKGKGCFVLPEVIVMVWASTAEAFRIPVTNNNLISVIAIFFTKWK